MLKNTRVLIAITLLLILAITVVTFFLVKPQADNDAKVFTSPHGTVTFKERGGVGPQTSRDILLSPQYADADLTKDTSARKFIIEQARDTGAIFIEKDCALSPISIKWPKSQKLKFINEDKSSHILNIAGYRYTVPAGQALTLSDSIASTNILKISCEGSTKIQGYLYFSD